MFSAVVFVILFGTTLAYRCGDAPETDGCSVWGIVPYKSYFSSECNKHDVCYSCGSAYGISRLACDKGFLYDLYDRCTNWWCDIWARTYYEAVREFGSGRYKRTSPPWCTELSWIEPTCLP